MQIADLNIYIYIYIYIYIVILWKVAQSFGFKNCLFFLSVLAENYPFRSGIY